MKKEDIHLGDWQRILLGDAPVEFTLEVLARTIVVYLIFLLVMRLLGKRMNAQLTIMELTVMVTLGAIVSVPMQIPNRGLLPTGVLLVCVLVFQRGLNWLALRKRKAEVLLQGDVTVLAKNGVLHLGNMRLESVSHEQLYAQLRNQQITQLGEVKRVYMEADGSFSIYKQTPPRPGLSVLPGKDGKLQRSQPPAQGQKVCTYCGYLATTTDHSGTSCPNCSHQSWTDAVTKL